MNDELWVVVSRPGALPDFNFLMAASSYSTVESDDRLASAVAALESEVTLRDVQRLLLILLVIIILNITNIIIITIIDIIMLCRNLTIDVYVCCLIAYWYVSGGIMCTAIQLLRNTLGWGVSAFPERSVTKA